MMNVAELIQALSQWDDQTQVHFSHSSGDYWRTQLAPAADSVTQGFVTYSDYHSEDTLITEEGEQYDPETRLIKQPKQGWT